MEKIRLQKIIADSGFCSRRKAEEYISEGKVTVNGRPVGLGDKADPDRDRIAIDGKEIAARQEFRYIILNKPRGYVTTMSDEKDRKIVTELLTGIDERVYPIGRLDRNSEGLLLFTNDGNFANDIMHPSKHVPKTYRVTINGKITEEQIARLMTGVELDDGVTTLPCVVEVLTEEAERTVLRFIIKEGRNRQIRRMCEALSIEVMRLKRTAVGNIKLGMLKPGTWRDLTPEELKGLRNVIGTKSAQKTADKDTKPSAPKPRARGTSKPSTQAKTYKTKR